MTRYGTETETTFLDKHQSTVEVVSNIRDFEITRRVKRYCIRIKVNNKQDEMTQFLLFSDMIDQKKVDGSLYVNPKEPQTVPSFGIEYRSDMPDGYYVIRTYTEIVI
jgi:hypothetical protein